MLRNLETYLTKIESNCSQGWSGHEDLVAFENARDYLMGCDAVEVARTDVGPGQGMDFGTPEQATRRAPV